VIRLVLERLFDPPALRDFSPRAGKAGEGALGSVHGVHCRFDPHGLPSNFLEPERDGASVRAFQDRPLERCHLGGVLLLHEGLERHADELLGLAANELTNLRRDIGQDAPIVGGPVNFRRPLRKKSKQVVGSPPAV